MTPVLGNLEVEKRPPKRSLSHTGRQRPEAKVGFHNTFRQKVD